jgi:hypothetical protein
MLEFLRDSAGCPSGRLGCFLEVLMTNRFSSLPALIVLGLANSATPLSAQPPQPAAVGVRLVEVAPDGTTKEVVREVKAAQLGGTYYVGDGLGYNLRLDLKDAGQFECVWVGCLGVYGKASGSWSVREDGLRLVLQTAEGLLKEQPLGRLLVVSFQKHHLLLQESNLDLFRKYGPHTVSYFHQEGARDALKQEWSRRVDEAAKKAAGASAK